MITTNFEKEVNSFKLKVPGKPTFAVSGNKLAPQHINVIKTLKKGTDFMIFSATPCIETYGSRSCIISIKDSKLNTSSTNH